MLIAGDAIPTTDDDIRLVMLQQHGHSLPQAARKILVVIVEVAEEWRIDHRPALLHGCRQRALFQIVKAQVAPGLELRDERGVEAVPVRDDDRDRIHSLLRDDALQRAVDCIATPPFCKRTNDYGNRGNWRIQDRTPGLSRLATASSRNDSAPFGRPERRQSASKTTP